MTKKYTRSRGQVYSSLLKTSSDLTTYQFDITDSASLMTTEKVIKEWICGNGKKVGIIENITTDLAKQEIKITYSGSPDVLTHCCIWLQGVYDEDLKLRVWKKNGNNLVCKTWDLDFVLESKHDIQNQKRGSFIRASLGWELLTPVNERIDGVDDGFAIRPNNSYKNGVHALAFRIINRNLPANDFENIIWMKSKIPVALNGKLDFASDRDIANYTNYKNTGPVLDQLGNRNQSVLVCYVLWNYDKSKSLQQNIDDFEIAPKEPYQYDSPRLDRVKGFFRRIIPNTVIGAEGGKTSQVWHWHLFGDDQYFQLVMPCNYRLTATYGAQFMSCGYMKDCNTQRMRFFLQAPYYSQNGVICLNVDYSTSTTSFTPDTNCSAMVESYTDNKIMDYTHGFNLAKASIDYFVRSIGVESYSQNAFAKNFLMQSSVANLWVFPAPDFFIPLYTGTEQQTLSGTETCKVVNVNTKNYIYVSILFGWNGNENITYTPPYHYMPTDEIFRDYQTCPKRKED